MSADEESSEELPPAEQRKERRFGLVIGVSIVVALVPLLMVVLGYYPSPQQSSGGERAADTVIEPTGTPSRAVSVRAPGEAPRKPTGVRWQELRDHLFGKSKPKKSVTTGEGLPAPAHAEDSSYVRSLLDSTGKKKTLAPAGTVVQSPTSDKKASSSSKSTATITVQEAKSSAVVNRKELPLPGRIIAAPEPERDSVHIPSFVVTLARSGIQVRGELHLYSTEKGLSRLYPAFAPAIQVAVENIFYITEPENLKIPRLEAQILQKVGFVFPQGAVSRVELRNLHTEWEKR